VAHCLGYPRSSGRSEGAEAELSANDALEYDGWLTAPERKQQPRRYRRQHVAWGKVTRIRGPPRAGIFPFWQPLCPSRSFSPFRDRFGAACPAGIRRP